MGIRAFVDTNVLVYLYDSGEPVKQARARELMLDDSRDLIVSAQVLNEFFVTVTRKIATPMPVDAAHSAVNAMAELEVVPITRNLVVDALATGSDHELSHWDAMIIQAASRSGCEVVFTEDMATGATFRGVEIVNPFVD